MKKKGKTFTIKGPMANRIVAQMLIESHGVEEAKAKCVPGPLMDTIEVREMLKNGQHVGLSVPGPVRSHRNRYLEIERLLAHRRKLAKKLRQKSQRLQKFSVHSARWECKYEAYQQLSRRINRINQRLIQLQAPESFFETFVDFQIRAACGFGVPSSYFLR